MLRSLHGLTLATGCGRINQVDHLSVLLFRPPQQTMCNHLIGRRLQGHRTRVFWEDEDGGEFAESETPTNDPCVTPSGPSSSSSRRRRRRRNAAAGETEDLPALPVGSTGNAELLHTLKQLLNERGKKTDTASNSSWTSKRGPEPGVRWRGGTPPQPPAWKYSNTDLRAFSRWERKIRVWQMQIKNYMTAADSALMLYTNLSGEAELEVEHLQLDRINSSGGVDYILETLRGPLQQKRSCFRNASSSQTSKTSHEVSMRASDSSSTDIAGLKKIWKLSGSVAGRCMIQRARVTESLKDANSVQSCNGWC